MVAEWGDGIRVGGLSLDLSMEQELKPPHDVGEEEMALGAMQFKII